MQASEGVGGSHPGREGRRLASSSRAEGAEAHLSLHGHTAGLWWEPLGLTQLGHLVPTHRSMGTQGESQSRLLLWVKPGETRPEEGDTGSW